MKFNSRSTLGVAIGILNIVVYLFASIGCIIELVAINSVAISNEIERQDSFHQHVREPFNPWNPYANEVKYMPRRQEAVADFATDVGNILFTIILMVCLVMVLISTLLVVGIVKKRHNLMAPWIILSIIGFICSCIRAVILLFATLSAAVLIGTVIHIFVVVCLLLGLQAMILYPICTLYRDIRNRNIECPGKTIAAGNVGFTNVYSV